MFFFTGILASKVVYWGFVLRGLARLLNPQNDIASTASYNTSKHPGFDSRLDRHVVRQNASFP